MRIALIQAPLAWEKPEANRMYFSQRISEINADLTLLPEMFTTGFTMSPRAVAEPMHGLSVEWMKSVARTNHTAVAGSLVIEEKGRYYNRLIFATPEGTVYQYDKRHLFTLAGENKSYARGQKPLVVNYKGWKICFQICYDLRFPVFSRNTQNYDLLVYVANWPAARINAWDALLAARAIENVCYVAAVNRVGTDENGHEYSGHSQIIDAMGHHLIDLIERECVAIADLDRNALQDIRKKYAFLEDRDNFTVSN